MGDSLIVDHLGNPIRSESKTSMVLSRVNLSRSRLKARYDASADPDGMRRWWANADALSADAANSAEVRRKLRMRARYEVANNSYAKGIVLTLANYIIGTGPRLQMLTANTELNSLVEKEFARWCKAINLASKLRTMVQSKVVDGEAFALLVTNPKVDSPVKLDVILVEADQVTTPYISMLDKNAVDGIRFDRYGNPAEYDILPEHPGSLQLTTLKPDVYKASQVLHWFRPDRPGQHRGISEIVPGLTLYAMLRRYGMAVVEAAETAANYSAVLEQSVVDGDEADPIEPFSTEEVERNMLTALPRGSKLNQLKAEQPTSGHDQFVRTTMNEASRCVNMPLNVALCDSSKSNYASGRMDYQVFYKAVGIDQADNENRIIDRLFNEFLLEARMVYDPIRDAGQMAVRPDHQYFWDGLEHVDPVKESKSTEIELGVGMTSFAREYARKGLDWENEMGQQAKALGLTLKEYQQRIVDKIFPKPQAPVEKPVVDKPVTPKPKTAKKRSGTDA